MKNNTRFIFTLTCILALVLFQSCDDSLTELEKLPPATQSGKGTFGCLVDGKAWVTELSTSAQGFYQTGTLSITAGLNDKNFDSVIAMHIYDLNLVEQLYQLAERGPESQYARYFDKMTLCEFFTTTTNNGNVTITHFDNVNFIISGTFEFEAYSTDCSKIIKITHGRFNLNYTA